MPSVRQMEALVWIAQLGTFERAAARLSTTQSAISKRIQELEGSVGFALFDRSRRGARLTLRGEEVLEIARKMLLLQDDIASLRDGKEARVQRRLRIGVTELTAMTWLPQLIFELRARHPGIIVEPDVANARPLHEGLLDGRLDIIACPVLSSDAGIRTVHLADVALDWMAQPGFIAAERVLSLQELVSYPLMLQGGLSGAGAHLTRWLRSEGQDFGRVLSLDSLMAIAGMTVAGLGISHLPRLYFQHLLDAGTLAAVRTTPPPPTIPYAAMYRQDHPSSFIPACASLMHDLCDFSNPV